MLDPVASKHLYAGGHPRPHHLVKGFRWHLLSPPWPQSYPQMSQRRFSSSANLNREKAQKSTLPRLTHLTEDGAVHMVSVSEKTITSRTATAACRVHFSNPATLDLIRENQIKKGDVLGVARVAGIMAAKRTPDLIPLCHPIPLTHASVELEVGKEEVAITATVNCDGKTGVEMEALMAASTAAMTVYDMCKAVDKGMVIDGLRVILKDGGRSGRWEMK